MDPITVLPAMTEPAAHIAYAANPTPSHGPTHKHPPYAEMITAAITALKDKNGSSRQAIAKYIGKEYTELPPTHSALLTTHLKRLKNNGHLVMVKNSYKLPGSVPLLPPHPPDYPTTTIAPTASFSVPKRPPGRPPKPRPDVQVQPNLAATGPEPMFISLGLEDGPPLPVTAVGKRGRGRPPKVMNGSVMADSEGPMLGKRGRGRPRRPKSLSAVMGNGGPKKGKGRGRPPRTGLVVVPLSGNEAPSGPKPTGRPRGRPLKNSAVNGGGYLPARRSGRPPKTGVANKLTGKTLGRCVAGTAVLVTDPHQLVAYQELKAKLEHLQSKIKQAVNVVKPCLNTEQGMALGALQELEALVTMDVSATLHVQPQEPPPVLSGF